MRQYLVIVGAGGLGREVCQYAQDALDPRSWCIKGFLDDNSHELEQRGYLMDVSIIGDTRSYRVDESDRFLIAVGDPVMRAELADRLRRRGARFTTLVHPRAYVAPSASLEEGCIISPFATVAGFCRLGAHVVLGFYAHVGHDSQVGAHSVLSPHAAVNGAARLAGGVFLGTHAVVTPGIQVGENVKIAAGAVVYDNVADNRLVMGNPGKAGPKLEMSS